MTDQTADDVTLIRERAYELWEQAGRPEGQSAAFWAQAQIDVKQSDSKPAEGSTIVDTEEGTTPFPPAQDIG